jgi:hypothetical protein
VKELYRQCHKYGVIEQTKIAMYARQMSSNFTSSFGGSKNAQFYSNNDPVNQLTIFQQFFKDPIAFKRQYLQIVIKMVQIFQEIKTKAEVFKPILERVFYNVPAFKFIDADKIITGFFFFYIYKDFVLRELIFWFSGSDENGIDPSQLKHIFIDKILIEYNRFIQFDFVQWINLMLACEVFQSYYSIVSPNES